MNLLKHEIKAFTLIETLLYVGVFSGVLILISSFLILMMQARVQYTVTSEVEQVGVFLMDQLIEEIQFGDTILSPLPGASSTSLSLSSLDPAENPITFSQGSDLLTVSRGVNSPLPLNPSTVIISGLNFTNKSTLSSPGSIQIEFTVTYSSNSSWSQYTYSKTFYGSASIR